MRSRRVLPHIAFWQGILLGGLFAISGAVVVALSFSFWPSSIADASRGNAGMRSGTSGLKMSSKIGGDGKAMVLGPNGAITQKELFKLVAMCQQHQLSQQACNTVWEAFNLVVGQQTEH